MSNQRQESESEKSSANGDPPEGRRDFVTKAVAVAAGAACGVAPAIAGICTFLDPIRERKRPSMIKTADGPADATGGPGRWLKVAALADVPASGDPQVFPVIADTWDAWNYHPPHPVGSVYLRKVSDSSNPVALTATCPHLGCFVDYARTDNCFKCPCHNSKFDLDGKTTAGPPPRGMDQLEVDVRNGSEVWVKFAKFQSGHAEKIAE